MCCGRGKSKSKNPTDAARIVRERKVVDGFSATKKSHQNGKRK